MRINCTFVSKELSVMANDEQALALFQTRVRQMILRFDQLRKENDELYAMVDSREREIKELREKLQQATHDYDTLKMMKMVEVSDGDISRTKDRLASLIRDVNKCIAILSEQK